jgi:hypothetical protein
MRLCTALATTAALAACGGTDAPLPDAPPLTDATSLTCPHPGDLPFRLMSTGFQNPASQSLAMMDPRIKDEASDTLGNPGGSNASIYLADNAAPTSAGIDYSGRKAVTGDTNGLISTGLAGEFVSLWTYDPASSSWMMLDRMMTDANGEYDFPSTSYTAANGQPVYALLEANGTCAEHFNYEAAAGTKVVVVDIDGTLTLSDNEFLMQVSDDTYVPVQMGAAAAMTQAWATKKYQVIYLTARPHVFISESRTWLETQGFPQGPIITENDGDTNAQPYKTLWLQRMTAAFGWDVYAAYGNALTDIGAYAAVNIPLSNTFIVGPEAGSGGTTPIENLDFTDHITSFIDVQPDNN